jgi:hypothetical protein
MEEGMDIKIIYAKCMQGNVLEAIEELKSIENKSDDILELEKKFIHRFVMQDEVFNINSEDPWIQEVLKCYYIYYIAVLTNNDVEKSEKQLAVNLANVLKVSQETDLEEIESELENIFKGKGYVYLGGRTIPYIGPYIWKTTKRQDFQVELPCNSFNLTVFFISDFLMMSWLHFATFGRHYAGGWAKEEGIYYVNANNIEIDTESDDFQVWFLKHEAQHLSDYAKYPNLNGVSLEYRAKLVELIYYPDIFSKLETFINESKNDESLAHPYAAFLIMKGLSNVFFEEEFVGDLEKWKGLDSGSISKEALKLFIDNEQTLSEVGETHVKSKVSGRVHTKNS